MEYLKTYENYVNESLILEKLDKQEKGLFKKISADLNINMGFLLTYGAAIAGFLPVVNHIIKNMNLNVPISNETVFLLSIAAFCIVFKEINFGKILEHIKKHELGDVFRNVLKTLKSFKNIFDFIIKNVKKSIEYIIDIFAYTSLLVPFIDILSSWINSRQMTLEEIIQCGIGIGLGILTIAIKNVIKNIWDKFKKYIKGFFSTNISIDKIEENLKIN